MARLTKADIEQTLLTGATLSWRDTAGKACQIKLSDPRERRLFEFLLTDKVREPTGLSDNFIQSLSDTYKATDDPALNRPARSGNGAIHGPWRLSFLKTEGFGGLNVWGGPAFEFDFGGKSLLLEGANGSGKSSLVGAIVWALSGDRPRDQTDGRAHELYPVLDQQQALAGTWPPIACYPPAKNDLKSDPKVVVELTFINPKGETAKASRALADGLVRAEIDPALDIPSILLETGILMPARLAVLRLGEKEGRLATAVQKLTGLDDLVAIGKLADGLTNRAREYLSYRKKELAEAKGSFDRFIETARSELAQANVAVPSFRPEDTNDSNGKLAALGKQLVVRAAELTTVVSSDLATTLVLTDLKVQSSIIAAIESAKEDLRFGLETLPTWKLLNAIASAFDKDATTAVIEAISNARQRGKEAASLAEQSRTDTKFQLKAVAAQWHKSHGHATDESCPLCEQALGAESPLAAEIESFKAVGSAATRTFEDNLNAILADFEKSLPPSARKHGAEILQVFPRIQLHQEIQEHFVARSRYANILVTFGKIVSNALAKSPGSELPNTSLQQEQPGLARLNERLNVAQRLLDISTWHQANASLWENWWNVIASGSPHKSSQADLPEDAAECLEEHISRLASALAEAEPYRKSAESMRKAWGHGVTAAEIDKEVRHRMDVADCLAQLKQLGSLSETVAREAINGLSTRIENFLRSTLITDQLQFSNARMTRKEGLVVHGAFSDEFQIDATLVANTSWLRAVLWAFLFSLRAEAVEQFSDDAFPVLVFDDPQATFDGEHRHRWAQQVALLQSGSSAAQVVLATYDEMFLDIIKVSGVCGRDAVIEAAGPELGRASIFEGQSLERRWNEAIRIKTKDAGQTYIKHVREYAEGLLRLMLRGEGATVMSAVTGFVVGQSREKITHLHAKKIAPWDRGEFKILATALGKDLPSIKHMEMSHHNSGLMLGMAEATDVEEHWRQKLSPALAAAFRLRRQHLQIHGRTSALHAPKPAVELPEGYQSGVKGIPLNILGRAAAMSDGRAADGRISIDNFPSPNQKKITLAQHLAFTLTAPTLEPVAQSGDILLVKEEGEPSPKSLVVALSDERILARRFELADNHADIAVLTAHSINPRQIAPPVIAQRATLRLHKIVGVLFNNPVVTEFPFPAMEICECNGEATLKRITANALGLIEVVGQSAEPRALNGQYIIIKNEISGVEALRQLVGKPIVASDTKGNRYFKRLQVTDDDHIVLESLDITGDHKPIVLLPPGDDGLNRLDRVWPVAGILFELP